MVLLRDSREDEVSYGVAMFEFSAVQEILDGTEPVFAGGDGFHEDSMAECHEAPWIRVAMQDTGVRVILGGRDLTWDLVPTDNSGVAYPGVRHAASASCAFTAARYQAVAASWISRIFAVTSSSCWRPW